MAKVGRGIGWTAVAILVVVSGALLFDGVILGAFLVAIGAVLAAPPVWSFYPGKLDHFWVRVAAPFVLLIAGTAMVPETSQARQERLARETAATQEKVASDRLAAQTAAANEQAKNLAERKEADRKAVEDAAAQLRLRNARLLRDAEDQVERVLKDPDSARFGRKVVVEAGEAKVPAVCGEVNAKNSFGGYTGMTAYLVVGDLAMVDDGSADARKLLKQFCS